MTPQAPPTAAELAAFNAWQAEQRALAGLLPAPAFAPAPAPADTQAALAAAAFKVGQIVNTDNGVAAIISVEPVTRTVNSVAANGTVLGTQVVAAAGYRIAYLPNVTDSHATEQELGLKVL